MSIRAIIRQEMDRAVLIAQRRDGITRHVTRVMRTNAECERRRWNAAAAHEVLDVMRSMKVLNGENHA